MGDARPAAPEGSNDVRRGPRLTNQWPLAGRLVLVLLLAASLSTSAVAQSDAGRRDAIKIGILTDCEGPFPDGYDLAIGGAQTAFYRYAGARPKNGARPSAGMIGGTVAGRRIELLYGCGDATPGTALRETRRLLERLGADILIGPFSGDEAVAVARYAKRHPSKTFVVGIAASQEPTLQIAPPNLFRYHADGAQWNAGIGEIVYRRLGWRTAAIIADDYSFGWTSAAGIIADFCAIGGRIVKRVFPPLNTSDYSLYVRELPPPRAVDGYFWAVGGTGTGPALRAFERVFGPVRPTQHSGNLFLAFLFPETGIRHFPGLKRRLVGAYIGGIGTAPGLKSRQAMAYEAVMRRWHPNLPPAVGYAYGYYNAAWATIRGLRASRGRVGRALQGAMPRTNRSGYEVSDGGLVRLDSNRQAIEDQYPLRAVRNPGGEPTVRLVGMVPNVDQTFGGVFPKTSPPPGRGRPACKRRPLPWQGKIRVVRNGVVTRQFVR
jgi:branched-chain amino acid transport system substrate-binding protein